jgi:hypothetical protein
MPAVNTLIRYHTVLEHRPAIVITSRDGLPGAISRSYHLAVLQPLSLQSCPSRPVTIKEPLLGAGVSFLKLSD